MDIEPRFADTSDREAVGWRVSQAHSPARSNTEDQ